MKISDVTVRRFNAGVAVPDLSVGRETLVVEVRTDEGPSGLGFIYSNVAAHGTAGDLLARYIRGNLRNLLLGKNPLHTESLWRLMYQSTWRQVRGRFGLMCLSGIDLAVPQGQNLAICGANGAGKSSLLRLMYRHHAPTRGAVRLQGFGSPRNTTKERQMVKIRLKRLGATKHAKYRIVVSAQRNVSEVRVQNEQGQADNGEVAQRIYKLLAERYG